MNFFLKLFLLLCLVFGAMGTQVVTYAQYKDPSSQKKKKKKVKRSKEKVPKMKTKISKEKREGDPFKAKRKKKKKKKEKDSFSSKRAGKPYNKKYSQKKKKDKRQREFKLFKRKNKKDLSIVYRKREFNIHPSMLFSNHNLWHTFSKP